MIMFCHKVGLSFFILVVCNYLTNTSASAISLQVKRYLVNSGFHRDLESTILLPHLVQKQCESPILMILETLPAGVYADPFQLLTAQQFGGPQVVFDRQVDIEAPSYSSKAHHLKIYIKISETSRRSQTKDSIVINSNLPIHIRYHQPSYNPAIHDATVSIFSPRLYLNCVLNNTIDVNLLTTHFNGTDHNWYQYSYESAMSKVVLRVPVGRGKDKPLVVAITLLTTVTVSALLCKSICSLPY